MNKLLRLPLLALLSLLVSCSAADALLGASDAGSSAEVVTASAQSCSATCTAPSAVCGTPDPASSVDPAKGGKSVFADGVFQRGHEPSPEGPGVDTEPVPDPLVDARKTLDFFVGKGKGWPAIKAAYGLDSKRMKAMVDFRKVTVDAILNAIVAEQGGEVGYVSNGSTNLTSDYDLSVFDKGRGLGNPAAVVRAFNTRFRAEIHCEAGTAFDTNIYDKGDTLPTTGVTVAPPVAQAVLDVAVDNAVVQDVAALVKVRHYMPDDDPAPPASTSTAWETWAAKSQAAVSADLRSPARIQLQRDADSADAQYRTAADALDAKIEALRKAGPIQSEEDVRLQASNILYADALDVVQEARNRQTLWLAKLTAARRVSGAGSKDRSIIEAANELRRATLDIKSTTAYALNFANEAYNSEGALIDVVGNQQGAVKAAMGLDNPSYPNGKQLLQPQDEISSLNEQLGDSLKDLQHYGSDPVTCGIQVSKYVDRFLTAVKQIVTRKASHPHAATLLAEVDAMVGPKTKLKAMRGNKDLPRESASTLIAEVAGAVAPEAYAQKMTRLAILANAIARWAPCASPAGASR